MRIDSEKDYLDALIACALREDLDEIGDVTSEAIFSDSDLAEAVIKCKSHGVLSGIYLIEPLFQKIDNRIKIEVCCNDGDEAAPGKVICILHGPVKGILAGERIILNFLQRLSGIATVTSQYVKAIEHTGTKLLDTRKTTPTLRFLEKKAVLHGGGLNHRFGLFDMILIKDTHVKQCGGPANALKKALDFRSDKKDLKVEVEVQSFEEFLETVEYLPDRIMLDNMSLADMKACVEHIRKNHSNIELEASGNITLSNIAAVAATGVDFISSGAITHSAPALDIHLVIKQAG